VQVGFADAVNDSPEMKTWAAQVAEEATPGTGFDLEMGQRRAYEVVNALLREIEAMTGHPAR